MKNKILFITVAFPPRLSPASLRIFSFAEELERQGHEVFVVTCDQGDDNKFNFNSSISEDNVYRIKYFDIFNFSSFIKNKFITALYKKLISFFISPTGMFYPDLRFLFWRKKALIICSDLIEKHNIDSIYSSFSPGSSHILANQLKKKNPNLVWLAEYRDLWSFNHNLRGLRKLFAKFEFRIEKKIVENANHLITVSKGLANFLSKKINKPVHVIYNGTNERRFEQIKTFQFHEPTIVYSGSIYNGKYDLTPFFEGFSLFMTRTDFRIKIRILFVGSKIPYSWIRLAKRLNIYSYIDFEPKQDINQVNAKQKGAFMLLLPLWKNEKQGIITSKIFEYLSVKSPILAIGNQSEVLELIEDYGKGIMSENPKEIANFIFENLQFHESINKSLKNIEKKEQVKQIIRLIKSSKYDEKS